MFPKYIHVNHVLTCISYLLCSPKDNTSRGNYSEEVSKPCVNSHDCSSLEESNIHTKKVPHLETDDIFQLQSDSVQKIQGSHALNELHFLICILSAVLVRISLSYNIGTYYVQVN